MFHSQSMRESKERRDRILDVAINLAEEGGFDNVRQRDVAEQAGVALGTLYKAFRTKEDLLSAALERQTQMLELRMETRPARGDTPVERVEAFFATVTRALCKKPRYARAVLRAMASGEPEVAANVASYQGRMNRLIIAALRGAGTVSEAEMTANPPTAKESKLALLLQQLWFAALVGWSADLLSQSEVVEQLAEACDALLRGIKDKAR